MMVEHTGVVLQYFNLEINSCMFGLLPTQQCVTIFCTVMCRLACKERWLLVLTLTLA